MGLHFAAMTDLNLLSQYLRVTREQWTREQKRELLRSPELTEYLERQRQEWKKEQAKSLLATASIN